MPRPIVNPGKVDWSGENPGIDLKDETGQISAQITYFRVIYSAHGSGHVVVFLTDPRSPAQASGHVNAVYTDNVALARYLLADFVQHFEQYQEVPRLLELPFKSSSKFDHIGSSNSSYSEVAETEDGELRLTWSKLGDPFLIEVPARQSPTKKHEIFSLFVPSHEARASVGSVHAQGRVFGTSIGGTTSSSAFLAFSETWIKLL